MPLQYELAPALYFKSTFKLAIYKIVFVLAVLVENGGGGSEFASPVARKILDYYLLGADHQVASNE